MKKTFSTADREDFFYPTLTTNGICNTFNEDGLSKIWRPANLTIAFKNVFKPGNGQSKKYFGGTGSSQGNYDLKSLLQFHLQLNVCSLNFHLQLYPIV